MSCRKVVLGLIVSGLVTAFAASTAFAQAGGAAATAGARPFNRGGNFMDNIKGQLGATDEEWTVLQPKLQKVMDLARQLRPSPFGNFRRGGRGGRGGEGGDTTAAAPAQTTSDVSDKSKALTDALGNKDADPKDIAQKLAALRDARERTRADLVKAQGELKELLTARQEAQLVVMGLLD